jgi:hypothetical protein
MKCVVKEKYQKFLIPLLAFATVCGITLNLKVSTEETSWIWKYLESMSSFSMTNFVLFAGVWMMYHRAFLYLKKTSFTLRDKIWIVIPAFLFANFMAWGYSFEKTNSYDLVLGGKLQMLKALTMIVAYFILFAIAIACLYRFLDLAHMETSGETSKNVYVRLFYKHPFLTPFVTMLICYIPYIIFSYPAIIMGDVRRMISQGYNFPDGVYSHIILLDENVFMTGQHGVIYPVILHIFLRLSKALFDNYNYGVFAVASIQLLSILAVVSCTLRYMIKKKIHFGIVLSVMIYYIAAPRAQSYMFLITKDVFSGCFMLLFLVTAYRMLKEPEERTKKRFVLMWLIACGAGMFRNDGKIVIGLSLLVMIFLMGRQLRKQLILVTAAFFLVVIGFNNVLMPALKITPVSNRALFSIPFQQTARYVKEYGDEVTEEEKEAIDAVLAYDKLAKNYKPQKSDKVKNTYKAESTRAEKLRYFKVWFQMFLKHPGVYFEATMNNYFYYVYPGKEPAGLYDYEWSTYCMEELINKNEYLATVEMEITYPEALDKARNRFEKLRENLFSLPGLNIFLWPAMFVWVFILLVCYLLRKKSWKLLAVQAPLFFSVLVCFASPCNGTYFRYLYGVSLCIPIAVVLSLKGTKEPELPENKIEGIAQKE